MVRTCISVIALTASLCAMAGERPEPAGQCVQQLESDSRLQPIRDKVALVRSEDTKSDMLELYSVATPAERSALALWAGLRQSCHEMGAGSRAHAAAPELAAHAAGVFERHQTLLGQLQNARITYAEFNSRSLHLYETERWEADEIAARASRKDASTPRPSARLEI